MNPKPQSLTPVDFVQRGGNLRGPGVGDPGNQNRKYGPFVASVGFIDAEEIAAGIGHEISHTLNVPFGEIPEQRSLLGQLPSSLLIPAVDASGDHTTPYHDNFHFGNPDYPGESSKEIWSLVRSGLYNGSIKQIDPWSRSLRKLFWEEANLRARQRLDTATNPPVPAP